MPSTLAPVSHGLKGEERSMQVKQSTLIVLRRAIQNDLAGQRFYFDAASYCIDPWAKEVFATLARGKERHVRRLLAEYELVRDADCWNGHGRGRSSRATLDITHLTFEEDEEVEGFSPFRRTAGQLVDRRSDDLQALALGIDMERSVLELYRQASLAEEDREVRKAYEFLLRDKARYYHRLRDQWQDLAGMPLDEFGARATVSVHGERVDG
jgi:rubrerythrin